MKSAERGFGRYNYKVEEFLYIYDDVQIRDTSYLKVTV